MCQSLAQCRRALISSPCWRPGRDFCRRLQRHLGSRTLRRCYSTGKLETIDAGPGFATKDLLRLRLKADASVQDIGSGIIGRMRQGLPTEIDAVGDGALSAAVKAIATANFFAEKEASTKRVAFVPVMATDNSSNEQEGGTKLMRFFLSDAVELPADEQPEDGFERGGIYVPVRLSEATPGTTMRGRIRRGAGSSYGVDDSGGSVERLATPTELSRTVLGEWVRFAAPRVRFSARAAKAGRELAEFDETKKVGRRRAPFIVTKGPPALARAVRAAAFAAGDIKKEKRFEDVPPFAILPIWQERRRMNTHLQKDTVSQLLIQCLVHLRSPSGSASQSVKQ
eukprot:TRINITY_DN41853_c0_g1_i1.p1 TRINITY_DN41853_c0_g1~~TRINITY_DN41853_c0_g1_i1.p1  ORF type:complete len:339 (-),score=77.39 TRINITY_DN41853_c0_g1_i1:13-1029(-)